MNINHTTQLVSKNRLESVISLYFLYFSCLITFRCFTKYTANAKRAITVRNISHCVTSKKVKSMT